MENVKTQNLNLKLIALRARIRNNRTHAEAQWLIHEYRQCLGIAANA